MSPVLDISSDMPSISLPANRRNSSSLRRKLFDLALHRRVENALEASAVFVQAVAYVQRLVHFALAHAVQSAGQGLPQKDFVVVPAVDASYLVCFCGNIDNRNRA